MNIITLIKVLQQVMGKTGPDFNVSIYEHDGCSTKNISSVNITTNSNFEFKNEDKFNENLSQQIIEVVIL